MRVTSTDEPRKDYHKDEKQVMHTEIYSSLRENSRYWMCNQTKKLERESGRHRKKGGGLREAAVQNTCVF